MTMKKNVQNNCRNCGIELDDWQKKRYKNHCTIKCETETRAKYMKKPTTKDLLINDIVQLELSKNYCQIAKIVDFEERKGADYAMCVWMNGPELFERWFKLKDIQFVRRD